MNKIEFKNLPDMTTPLSAENLNQLQDNVEDAIVPIKLVSVGATAPATATIGDMYYNTTDNKIYTATAKNTWDSGSEPRYDGFYIDINNHNTYYYNGTSLVISSNEILTSLSDIGITITDDTTLDAIVTAVPNGKTLQLYLTTDNATTLYNSTGGRENIPATIAGLLTVEKRSENGFAFIKYQTTESIGYPDNNPDGGVYYTTKLNVYRDWIKSGTAEQVLWSNPDPSNVVNADYVIDLSSSDYDELRWIFTYSNTTSNQFSVNCLKGMNVMATTIGYANASLMRRIIDYVSPTQYKCRVAMFNDAEAPGNVIPVTVIGIKR